jgi:hypothetical protein
MWRATLHACKRLGGEVSDLVIVQPATEHEVALVEAQIGMRLPDSFREVLLQFSSRVEFWWSLPDHIEPPPVDGIFWGGCWWDLAALPDVEQLRRDWARDVFPDTEDPYDRVWHDKLTFLVVANGDHLAIDLSDRDAEPVVYLSHEEGETHGYLLGNDFADFVDRWSLLGCPGPEEWKLAPFLPSPTTGLDPYSEEAVQWRQWLGLSLDTE